MTASVLAGPSMKPIPAPAMMMYHDWALKLSSVTLPGPEVEADRGQGAAEHDRALGAPPVQHPPADLGGDDEAEEEVQQEEAGLLRPDLPSAICAYSLAKKNTGMNTSMVMPSTRFSTRKARMRKMLTCMSGDGGADSTKSKTTSRARPAAMHSPMPGLLQPQIGRLLEAERRSEPTPPAISTSPR